MTIVEDIDARAAERGDESSRVHDGWILGILEWLAGRWQLALEHATARWELAEQIQNPHSRGWVGRAKALIEIDLGLADQARATVEETISDDEFSRASTARRSSAGSSWPSAISRGRRPHA